MATKKKKQADEESEPERPSWPIEGKTVVLAKDRRPPTEDAVINIGMEGSVHVPDEATQREGFTPFIRRGSKAVDATQLLLSTFPGIYKPVVEKGA